MGNSYNVILPGNKKEVFIDLTPLMNFRTTILSERSYLKSTLIPFILNSRKCELTYSDRKQISACLGESVRMRLIGILGNFWG